MYRKIRVSVTKFVHMKKVFTIGFLVVSLVADFLTGFKFSEKSYDRELSLQS